MLDPKFIKDNIDAVANGAKAKGISFDPNAYLELYELRLKTIQQTDSLRNQRNTGSEIIKKCVDKNERDLLIAKMRQTGADLEQSEAQLRDIEQEFQTMLLGIPSIPSTDTPFGLSDKDNVELFRNGDIPQFDFIPKDHLELGKSLDIIDFERGVDIAGARSYFLKGAGAELERAIHSLTLDLLKERSYLQMSVPVLVKTSAMEGTGYLPGSADQAYQVEKDKLWLVGTSEVPLTSFHQNEIFKESDLPIKLCAWSTCFRREAGAAGKDTKGLYRVHQFQKIEQVIICLPDEVQSNACHEELLKNSLDILELLEIPCRVVQVCTGDLGQGQVKKNDLEAWMPSKSGYRETHSCSSFHDYQARRLKIRIKDKNGQTRFCYTLNNTAIATPRVLIPFLENHQTADGQIRIPNALKKYLGNRDYL